MYGRDDAGSAMITCDQVSAWSKGPDHQRGGVRFDEMAAIQVPVNDDSLPWKQHMDAGAAYVRSGMTDRALEAYQDAITLARSDAELADSHVQAAHVFRLRSDWDDARKHAAIALDLAHRSGSDDLAAEALNVEVGIHMIRGNLDEAATHSARGLALSRSARVRGITLQNQATIAARRAEFGEARRLLEESIVAFREARNDQGIATSLVNSAAVAMDAGELNRALDLGDEAIAFTRTILAHDLLLTAVQNQAHVMVKLGWFEKAQTMVTEAFGFFTTARNLVRQAECLEIMGELNSMRDGDLPTAHRAFTLAKEIADKSGDSILSARLASKLEKFD